MRSEPIDSLPFFSTSRNKRNDERKERWGWGWGSVEADADTCRTPGRPKHSTVGPASAGSAPPPSRPHVYRGGRESFALNSLPDRTPRGGGPRHPGHVVTVSTSSWWGGVRFGSVATAAAHVCASLGGSARVPRARVRADGSSRSFDDWSYIGSPRY
ncbi:hypothetical protein NL676_014032 [Syzygium grande]|nr:hypothetical protein NL676_014032 [Syzygium grande]